MREIKITALLPEIMISNNVLYRGGIPTRLKKAVTAKVQRIKCRRVIRRAS
jgi:hypothetical protein